MVATGGLILVGLAVIALVVAGVFAPYLLIVALLLFVLPFALGLSGAAFRHAQPRPDTEGGSVPSTREASYEPVEQPRGN